MTPTLLAARRGDQLGGVAAGPAVLFLPSAPGSRRIDPDPAAVHEVPGAGHLLPLTAWAEVLATVS